MSELDEFFDTVWADTPGYVYLPTAERDSHGKIIPTTWKRIFFQWPDHREAVSNHVTVSAARGLDVFFGPAIYHSLPKKNENASKSHIKGSHVLWVDFDGNAPESWENTSEKSLSARPEDQTSTPPPSLVIQSSDDTHQHVYWRLDEFTTDLKVIEEKNRALAYLLKADTSGWDANQVLRPPESINHKNNLPVHVVDDTGDKFPVARFSYLRPAADVIKYDELVMEAVVDIEPIKTKYTWVDQFTNLFFSSKKELVTDRSNALMQVAYFGAEIGMTDIEIFSLLVDADNRWEKYSQRSPGQRQRLLSGLVNRARIKHPTPVTDVLVDIATGIVDTEVDTKYIYNFQEFIETEFNFDWLIPSLITRGGAALVASAPGVGKTQFCIRLGMAFAVGRKFLHWTPPTAGKVLVLSLEMGGPSLHKFMSTMAKSETPEDIQQLAQNFFVVPLGEPIPMDKEPGIKFMEKVLSEYQPDLVIIDSFSQLLTGKLNDDDVVRKTHGDLARLRKKYDCGMLMIHHSRKGDSNNKKPVTLDDVFGNVYMTAPIDYVATLWREQGKNEIEYREVKNRLDEERPMFAYSRQENLTFHLIEGGRDTDSNGDVVGGALGGDSSGGNEGEDRSIFRMG